MADTIGKRIRAARERYGMSQAELARRVKISPQSMNVLELGKTDPRSSLIAAIARVLHVTTDYLHGLSEEEDFKVAEYAPV